MRTLVGVVATLGVAAVGGAVLGEYSLSAGAAVVAGGLLGVVEAEALVTATPRPPVWLVALASGAGAAAAVWALWIAAGHRLDEAAPGQWTAANAAALAVGGWVVLTERITGRGRRRA